MEFNDYQRNAAQFDQFPGPRGSDGNLPDKAELVPLLGLVGEVGALLSEYKKLLRDGPVHLDFREQLAEELGDTLWYIAAVASKFELSLDDIAAKNLEKVRDRWGTPPGREHFDTSELLHERLPRQFEYKFGFAPRKDGSPGVVLFDAAGSQIGDALTDNAHENDGYRFHDVMHFAFVALLGWSPVARKLLNRKRKTEKKLDEVEDGGRASVIDEAIVAMIFDYIKHDLTRTEGLKRIDTETLRGIRALTRGFEVHRCTELEWENAILKGLDVWRKVERHDGGTVRGDYDQQLFEFIPPG